MTLFIIVFAFILIAVGVVWFLLSHDKGQKEPVSALWIAAGFGFGGCILAAVIEHFTISSSLITGNATRLEPVLLATLGVGLIEEVCKFFPLAIFIYPKKYFNEHTDGIIYFAIVGLAFGVPENILYSIQFGAKVGLFRLILTPIFHAATTVMIGYFLVKSKIDKRSLLIPIIVLIEAIILHGFYDFGLASGLALFEVISLMITIGMSVLFLVLFMRANELDKQEALSVVGKNNYCRSCGEPNLKHLLYCEHCGKRA